LHDLRKQDPKIIKSLTIIDLALKMSMKGMCEEAIAGVLEIEPSTVRRWLCRDAEQCDKVNENFMKNLNLHKIEMDELWLWSKKNSPENEGL
jgi:uncharacterized protein YjcR